MLKHNYFDKDDFIKWLSVYNEARYFVHVYNDFYSDDTKKEQREEYVEAKRIIAQHKILYSSLNNPCRSLLKKLNSNHSIAAKFSDEYYLIKQNWIEIVVDTKENEVEELDLVKFGGWLKNKRMAAGYSRAKAARFLKISDNTLKAYESGKRQMSISILFKVQKLYNLSKLNYL